MFLTRGVMYHEAIWDLWFRSAAGLLPVAALSAANCEPGLLEHLGHSCGARAGGGALQQQHLFSVFVHVGANEEGFSGAQIVNAKLRCMFSLIWMRRQFLHSIAGLQRSAMLPCLTTSET